MVAKLPCVTDLIHELIANPSVSCTDATFDQSNAGVIHALADWLDSLGFAVSIQDIKPGKANLVATLGATSAPTASGLVLAGHTDTVPYDLERWTVDPFKGTQQEGRIYGLGSCDMKGFFALAIAAAQAFDARQFRQPLTIIATADE